MAKLDSLSPLAVVDRGYSIASKKNKVINSVSEIVVTDLIEIRVSDGTLLAEVKTINKNQGVV